MERIARNLSNGRTLAALFVLVVINAALFLPAMGWIVPNDLEITGLPTVTHLQLSWTSDQFSHNLAEWSGEACWAPGIEANHCTWPRAADGDGFELRPAPVPDGPAGFKRMTLLLDYTFPILYSLFAIGLAVRLWRLLGRNRRWLRLVAGAGVGAGLCDMAENTIHLWILRGVDTWEQAAAVEFPGGLVASASLLASIKYGILLLFVVAAVVWAVRWPISSSRVAD